MQQETHALHQSQQTYRRTLGYAEAIAGGVEPLASRLRVSSSKLQAWLDGLLDIPDSIYLAIVDVICDASSDELLRARPHRALPPDEEDESRD